MSYDRIKTCYDRIKGIDDILQNERKNIQFYNLSYDELLIIPPINWGKLPIPLIKHLHIKASEIIKMAAEMTHSVRIGTTYVRRLKGVSDEEYILERFLMNIVYKFIIDHRLADDAMTQYYIDYMSKKSIKYTLIIPILEEYKKIREEFYNKNDINKIKEFQYILDYIIDHRLIIKKPIVNNINPYMDNLS